MIESIVIYGITGLLTGFIAGLLGIGGGIIVVPALLYIFNYTGDVPQAEAIHYAAGTSLAIMIFTALSSVIAHQRKNGMLWNIYVRIFPGIVLGTITGALLSYQIPTQLLKIILGLFLLFIAFEMIYKPRICMRSEFPSPLINRLISFLIGLKSGLLGIGGGVLIIPYLSYCGVQSRQTAGITSLCTLTIALIGTSAFFMTAIAKNDPTQWTTGYIYWPAVVFIAIPSILLAPLGAYFSYRLPIDLLKHLFTGILIIVATHLLVKGL